MKISGPTLRIPAVLLAAALILTALIGCRGGSSSSDNGTGVHPYEQAASAISGKPLSVHTLESVPGAPDVKKRFTVIDYIRNNT